MELRTIKPHTIRRVHAASGWGIPTFVHACVLQRYEARITIK